MQPPGVDRRVGSHGTHGVGALLIVIVGVHGNEPAGVHAAREVLGELDRLGTRLSGRLIVLAANLRALREGRRFIEQDFNRMWSDRRLAALDGQRSERDDSEESEQRALLAELRAELAGARSGRGRVILLDLHSTSAGGAPFAILGDTLANRRIAFELGVPTILGLEENVSGTLLEHFGELGHTAVCFEGGQHADPNTVRHHVAAIWITLVSSGLMRPAQVPDWSQHKARLARACRGLPRVVEVLHRHAVEPDEDFRMLPGYENFQPVHEGQVLATVEPGGRSVRPPRDGLILMPRYQSLGSDGFFLARAVSPLWLGLSAVLRRLRWERLLPLLPGVRRGPDARSLVIDRRLARWRSLDVFHLFGYRKLEEDGTLLTVTRRVEQPAPPVR